MSDRPPWLLHWLLARLLPPHDREFILGDLEEEYAASRARGRWRALYLYAGLGVRSVLAQRLGPQPSYPTENRRTGSGLMDELRQNVLIGVRGMLLRPALTLAIVLTLALAIGANTAMFSVVNAVLLRPLPFPEPDRLITIWHASNQQPTVQSMLSDPDFRDWQARSKSFEAMATYRSGSMALTGFGEPEMIASARVSEDFFRVAGLLPILGRPFARSEIAPNAPPLVVISEAFWRDRMNADPAVLGRALVLNGAPRQIIGVAPRQLAFPGRAQLWTNDGIDWERCGRGCSVFNVFGRLADGATLASATSELNGIARSIQSEDGQVWGMANLIPLDELTVGSVRRGLWVLLGAVGLVLLIACANVANLLFTAGSSRATELAVRASLGGSRGRIVRQLLTESLLLSLAGAILGILLAHWCVTGLGQWAAVGIPRVEGVGIDGTVLLYLLGALVLTALLFGLAPALTLSRLDPGRVLAGARGAVGADRRTLLGRAALITSQVTLSIVLLVGTGLLLRTLSELQQVPLGFDAENVEVYRLSLPEARYPDPESSVRFYQELQGRIRAIPAVESVGGIAGAPLNDLTYNTSYQAIGLPETRPEDNSAMFRPALPGYFETLNIGVLRGRSFTDADTHASQPVIILSRSLAESLWGDRDPIGQQMRIHGSAGFDETEARTIVGVVDDVRSVSLKEIPKRELYLPHAQSGSSQMTMVVRTRPGSGSAAQEVREQVRALDPELPFRRVGRLSDDVSTELAAPTFYFTLLGLFAGLALLLSAIGLYGVVGYQVALRRREVGIRVAVGAQARDVVSLIALQGLKPALIGVGLGIPASIAAVTVLQKLLFNTDPLDPRVWVGTVGLVIIVALAAALIPALRAARIQPVEALRSD